MPVKMPRVTRLPDGVIIGGGMDVVVPPMFAKPGIARLAYNYEYSPSGGSERIGGLEPFDGHARPSDATYQYMKCSATISGIVVGDTVTGVTSTNTAKVIYISGAMIAVTRNSGLLVAEDLQVGGVTKATVSDASATIDGFLDNQISKLAADEYQTSIAKVPGEGRIRGVAIVNDLVYAWRNNVGSTAMAIYKSSASGWTAVTLYYELSFTLGTALYAEGATITQGGVSATVKRVVTESGTWSGGNAAGRLIITAPSGGNFAGATLAAGGGGCTTSGAATQITLAANGIVRTYPHSFTSSASRRLYGCDGVNREFEFDGDILVPITTGMGSTRARAVVVHKNHLMYGYSSSLQHSSIGNPYVWSPVTGASELACAGIINDLVSLAGQADAASLFIGCQDGISVLYGTSSSNWNLVTLSKSSGAQQFSCQDIGGVVALDNQGVMRYPQTLAFGNFAWNNVSTSIQPIVSGTVCQASVWASNAYKYRLFFSDGTAISGLPIGTKAFAWSVINYGRKIMVAICDDIASVARTFYGDDQGWVYEADVGRSFAGDTIEAAMKLHPLSQRSPMIEKHYRDVQIEVQPKSAFTLYVQAEYGTNDDGPGQEITTPQYGAGGQFDLSDYDQAYWDTNSVPRLLVPADGDGTSIALTFRTQSDNELPHTLYGLNITYTPRKIIQ